MVLYASRMTLRRRHVALIIETSNAYGRGLLQGIRRFAENGGWTVYFGETSRAELQVEWLGDWNGDGVIARIENERIADQLRGLERPVVDVSAPRLVPEFPCVETDDAAIARMAFGHLREAGLTSFAWCGDSRFQWSQRRAAAFAEECRSSGFEPRCFDLRSESGWLERREALGSWLISLPRPTAVFACYDIAGYEILETCADLGIRVPDDIAVLGVDNDELLARLTSPPLSSILPDARGAGYLAAQILDSMMRREPHRTGTHLLPPLRVVQRQSSDILAVADIAVAQALRMIRRAPDDPASIAEICRTVGLSRRALDSRFRAALGRTVHAEVTRVRLARVAHLLVSTTWTLDRIAEHTGFAHAEYMSTTFRQRYGSPPGRYRDANRPAD